MNINLDKLVKTQQVLHDRIVKEHELEHQDLLPNTILALLVEVGELANEWRGFKHWSKDQEPRTSVKCSNCYGRGKVESDSNFPRTFYKEDRYWICLRCEGAGSLLNKNPLLEEYVDGLSFILEISLLNYQYHEGITLPIWSGQFPTGTIEYRSIVSQFNYLFNTIGYFLDCADEQEIACSSETEEQFENIVEIFLGLGDMLGFTGEEVEKAYFDKNQINHVRQNEGY